MFDVKLLCDGSDADASGGKTFERCDPASGATVTRAAAGQAGDAVKLADAAAAAFPAWSATSPNARRSLLQAAAAKLREKASAFVERSIAETGSSSGWAQFNVHFAAMLLEEAAAMTTQIGGEVVPSDHPGTLALAVRQPCGVVVGMAPWNAPVILGVRALAMALACGNSAILKASEFCPATHRLIGDVFTESGFPPGVVNVMLHAAADAPVVAEALIAHPAVRRVNFTGSTRVGRLIAETAGRHLKPVLLELGGKAPLLVLDDADLEAAAAAANFGAFLHQGQICMSTERVIVDAKVADAFLALFRKRAAALPAGTLVDEAAAERVEALLADATAKGAGLLCGGKREGASFQPTIVDGVTSAMRLYREESFGPVVAVIRAKDTEDALRLANDSAYGLAAAVFGRDLSRALSVARRLESGICHINSATVQDEAQMPFGGVKNSGYGRFGGRAAIDAFTELRWISIAAMPRHYPI